MAEKHLSDSELLEKFRTADGANYAFNLLVRKHSPKMYNVIRRLVIDHEDADDVLQNTWIKVWQNLASFKAESQLFTWLYRIASNEAISFLNKKKKRFFLNLNDVEAELSRKIDANADFDGNEIEQKLQKAILELPEKQRLVFHMRYYDEMPYEQMSEVLQTSVGALKASYHHAVKKIEKFVKGHD